MPGPMPVYGYGDLMRVRHGDYHFEGTATLDGSGVTLEVPYVRVMSPELGKWHATIRMIGLSLKMKDMLGGTVRLTTSDGMRGNAIATGTCAESVWSIELEGIPNE